MVSELIVSILLSSGVALAEEPAEKGLRPKRGVSGSNSLEQKPVLAGDFSGFGLERLVKMVELKKCKHACQLAGKRHFGEYSPSYRHMQISNNDCRLTLVDDWMKAAVDKDAAETVIGEVSCSYWIIRPMRGRLPIGNHASFVAESDLAAHYARASQEEALSVFAFQQLATRLSALGAPTELVERCLTAAIEEREHAAFMLKRALDAGAELPPLSSPEELPLSLFELTLHNAVFGLVNESWAAVLASAAALNAPTHLRDEGLRIADDELSHADLALDIHSFLMGLISKVERKAVISAMVSALEDLSVGISDPDADLLAIGEPSAAMQHRLMTGFRAGMHDKLIEFA